MKIILFSFFFLFSFQIFAQKTEIRRKMTFAQFIKEAQECKGEVYQLSNADIQINHKDQYRFSLEYVGGLSQEQEIKKNNVLKHFVDSLPEIILSKPINLYQVNFLPDINQYQSGILFLKCTFEKSIAFYDCNVNHVIFAGCHFKNLLLFLNERENPNKIGNIQIGLKDTSESKFGKCILEKGFRTEIANNKTNIRIFSVVSKNMIDLNYSGGAGGMGMLGDIEISQCTFSYAEKSTQTIRLLGIWATEANRLLIDNCQFEKTESANHGLFLTGRYKGISLKNNILDVNLHTYRLTVEDDFIVENNQFNKKFSPSDGESLKFDLYSTNISWDQIKGKLTTDKTIFNEKGDSLVIYEAQSDAELANEDDYKRLLALYGRFYTLYKNRIDMQSANACRIEIKNIETRKSAYDYRQTHTLKAYLDWQMNVFLRDFSDYGTDYVKSMIYALQVITFFAIFYFFFPSQEDNLSKNRFLKFFTKAIEYFRTDKQLTDFQQETRKEELEKLETFRQNLIDSQGKIPQIIVFLGKPFYYQNLYFTEFALWLLHRTDLAKGKWSEIPAKRKLFLGTLVTLYFLFYVCNGLFMRALNALALSLNFFTTLGYGEMQVRGWLKYLAVLEGAVGWFLLTVFSASLVSQLLQ